MLLDWERLWEESVAIAGGQTEVFYLKNEVFQLSLMLRYFFQKMLNDSSNFNSYFLFHLLGTFYFLNYFWPESLKFLNYVLRVCVCESVYFFTYSAGGTTRKIYLITVGRWALVLNWGQASVATKNKKSTACSSLKEDRDICVSYTLVSFLYLKRCRGQCPCFL